MEPKKLTAAILITTLTAACGGGGSNDPLFVGGYTARLVPVENNCRAAQPPFDRVYTVNQEAERVVVDTDADEVFEGIVAGDDRFLVSRTYTKQCVHISTREPIPGSFLQTVEALEFVYTDGNTAQVTLSVDKGNCSKNIIDVSCRYKMTGTAKRNR